MATLQRINQATLMQLRAQQDANQIAQAAALQQIVSQKQQQDALKAAFRMPPSINSNTTQTVAPLIIRLRRLRMMPAALETSKREEGIR